MVAHCQAGRRRRRWPITENPTFPQGRWPLGRLAGLQLRSVCAVKPDDGAEKFAPENLRAIICGRCPHRVGLPRSGAGREIYHLQLDDDLHQCVRAFWRRSHGDDGEIDGGVNCGEDLSVLERSWLVLLKEWSTKLGR